MRESDPDPLQRVKSVGIKRATIVDLISVGFSRHERDVPLAEDMARAVLTRFGSVSAFCDMDGAIVTEATGIDGFELMRTQALIEIGRRSATSRKGPPSRIDAPEDVVQLLAELLDEMAGEKREHFFAVLLDSKGGVMRVAEIHIGTLTMSLVGAREVFREAIREGASGVIVGHNHPSGDPTPSPEDIEVTRRLVELGEMLDIRVEDHVILGDHGFVSLKRQRLM